MLRHIVISSESVFHHLTWSWAKAGVTLSWEIHRVNDPPWEFIWYLYRHGWYIAMFMKVGIYTETKMGIWISLEFFSDQFNKIFMKILFLWSSWLGWIALMLCTVIVPEELSNQSWGSTGTLIVRVQIARTQK